MDDETRLAVVETEYKFISESLKRVEAKLDKYNGTRERIDKVCEEFKEHKEDHWKSAGLVIAGAGVCVTVIMGFLKVAKII
jgi:hypothetical protein